MIVKNEELRLGNCLSSLQEIADQIVIVDTGSTDRTVAIAQQFAQKLDIKILHFNWCDDFSAARNFALQQTLKCTESEWILVLDADEVLLPQIATNLRKLLANPDYLVINLWRQEIGAKQSPYSLVSRLFRRHPQISFDGIYHESIDRSVLEIVSQAPHWQIINFESVAIAHYGYQAEALTTKAKFAKRLMQNHLQAFPQDAYMLSKLGALQVESGEISEGIALLETGLAFAESNPAILFELHYHLAIARTNQLDLDQAKEHYLQALAQPVPDRTKLPAHHNLANLDHQLGNQVQAIAAYEQVIAIAPDFAQAHYNLGIALRAAGRLTDAVRAYEQAIFYDAKAPAPHQNLGVVWLHLGQQAQAIAAFGQAIQLYEQQQNFEVAQALRANLADLGLL